MQVLQSLAEELKSQVLMQMKDFSILQQIEKQIQIILKKEITVSSELNELSQLSNKLLDLYFLLEEEIEIQIYKIQEDNSMQNESDQIALEFSIKIGNIAISLINYCFKMSLKSNDIESRFTKCQFEELLVININFSRKLLDFEECKKYEDHLKQICLINSLIFDFLKDQFENNENIQNLFFCNEFNKLEIDSLDSKTNFSDTLRHCIEILKLFQTYPQLDCCKQSFIENILSMLFNKVKDCSTKKVDELIKTIEETPSLIEVSNVSYKQHYVKLQLINAIDHKDIPRFEKLEKEYQQQNSNNTGDFFTLILNVRKLKMNSDEKAIEQTLKYFEEYQIKFKPIDSYNLQQVMYEISQIDIKFYYLTFVIFQQYIIAAKNKFLKDNKIQSDFFDILLVFCSTIDEYFQNKDYKKQLENILESIKDCIKQLIAIILSVKKLNVSEITSLQIFYQKMCKIILEVGVNLKDLKEKPVNNTIEIIEMFLLVLKKEQKDNAQHQIFIDEVSCIGLICAIKTNNGNSIKEFSHNIKDSFSILPQILLSQTKKEEVSSEEFQKLLNTLMKQNNQQGKNQPQNNQNLINLFAFKNLINQMDSYSSLLQFYISYIELNFDEYFTFFRQNFIENYIDRASDISICTPFVKKITQYKQNMLQNIPAILETTKMLFTAIEKFYKYYSTKDKDIPLAVLITEKERRELIELFNIFFADNTLCSDPRISCKFLHYIILYSCLDIVFDNQCDEYYDQTFLNQCIFKLNFIFNMRNEQNPITKSQHALFSKPYFLRSLILLYSYQVTFYELTLNSPSSTSKNSIETLTNLIESYELTSLNLIDYLADVNQNLVNESLKNQFFLFQFIFTILQNNITKSLSIVEIFFKLYPDQLVLLSQISKVKLKPELNQIINKKYIYYLSSKNYQVKNFSLELILDLVESINDDNQIESTYIPVKIILEKVINSEFYSRQQDDIIQFIIRELSYKLKKINNQHLYIKELQQIQTKIKSNESYIQTIEL